jgi:hypothetical protein
MLGPHNRNGKFRKPMLERLTHRLDTWSRRLLRLNTEIVEVDARLAAALCSFFGRSDAGGEVTEISG